MVKRALVLLLLAGCGLDPSVLYRCNPDGGCSRAGYSCEGTYCVPDGTMLGDEDAGEVDAGEVDAGEPDAGEPDAGSIDAGLDAGVDAGIRCPNTTACAVACGFVDAGPTCQPLFCGNCAAGEHCGAVTPNTCGTSALSLDEWTWENLLPQGNTLRAAFARSRREAWFVGDSATVLFFDGERFQLVPVPVGRDVDLLAIDGNANELLVAGTNGTILSFRNGAWTNQSMGTTTWRGVTLIEPAAQAGERAVVVGNGAALRRISNSWSTVTVGSNTDLISVASSLGGLVRALSRQGSVYTLGATSFDLETPLPVGTGRSIVTIGNQFWAMGRSQLPDGGDETSLIAAGASFDAGVVLARIPYDGTAFLPQPGSGFVYVATSRGQLVRINNQGVVSQDLAANARDGDAVNAIAFLDPNTLALGGMQGKFATCINGCNLLAHYAQHSTGSSRDLFQVCGTDPSRLTVLADRNCNSDGGCSHRIFRYDPSVNGRWVTDDVASIPQAGGRLAACVDLGNEVLALTENGNTLRRASGGSFSQASTLGLGGRLVAATASGGEGSPYDRTVYLLTDQNRVIALPDSGVMGFAFTDIAGPPQQTGLWGVDYDLLTVGPNGSTTYIDRPGSMIAWNTATSGGTDSQRDLHGARQLDGGRLLVSAGDRGSLWWRTNPFDGGVRFRGVDAGTQHDFTSVWVSRRGLSVAGTSKGRVVYGVPEVGGFSESASLVGRSLNDVWGLSLPDGGLRVWVIGNNGALMSRTIP